MAINDFSNQNIQDTYQRVVQTDGTNRLADGTGSIFIPVSSSHAITASHALFAVSASHEITFEVSSSHAINADTASFATNFTASGDISASGDIVANFAYIATSIIHNGDTDTGIAFNTDRVTLVAGNSQSLNITPHTVELGDTLRTHVTASGNISSSGNVIANKFFIGANEVARTENSVLLINHDDDFDQVNINRSNAPKPILLSGNITASGDISASGVITARQFFAENTDNTAVIGLLDADGNNIASLARIGTGTNAHKGRVVLRDNANVKVDIRASGDSFINGTSAKLGVGTDSPDNNLHVVGDVRISGKGHITASGNISSSGTIIANKVESDSLFSRVGDANTGIQLGSDTVQIEGNNTTIATFTTNKIDLNIPVTASGNISASGNVFGDSIRASSGFVGTITTAAQPNITSVGTLTGLNVNGNITGSNISASGTVTAAALSIPAGDALLGNGSLTLGNASTNVTLKSTGHITASGNISASGTIIGLSGSFTHLSSSGTVFAKALDLEGANLTYNADHDILKFGDDVKLGIGAGPVPQTGDLTISSDGTDVLLVASVGNVTLNNTSGDTIIRNQGIGKDIILQTDKSPGGQQGGQVLVSGSNADVRLQVLGNITASGNISASGDLIVNNITGVTSIDSTLYKIDGVNAIDFASDTHLFGSTAKFTKLRTQKGLEITAPVTASSHISASGTIIANEINVIGHITASGDISASGNINLGQGANYIGGKRFITSDDGFEFRDGTVKALGGIIGKHITASGNISASGHISASGGAGAGFVVRPNLYFFATNTSATLEDNDSEGSLPSTNTTIVTLSQEQNSHPSVFSLASNEVTIARAGLYKMSFNVTTELNNGSGRAESFVGLVQETSGGTVTLVDGTEGRGYHRFVAGGASAASGQSHSAAVIVNVAANSKYTLRFGLHNIDVSGQKLRTIDEGTSFLIEAIT